MNQHATIEEAVFSVGAAPRLYNEDLTQLELGNKTFLVICRIQTDVVGKEG
jgi:hypothetical protein